MIFVMLVLSFVWVVSCLLWVFCLFGFVLLLLLSFSFPNLFLVTI